MQQKKGEVKTTILKPAKSLQSFVAEIILLEDVKTATLPFYADGFPGLVFNQTTGDTILLPRKKKLSHFFLYGQTVKPIKIVLPAAFRMIVFKLYPFASSVLFGVDPKALNDDCFDLTQADPVKTNQLLQRLNVTAPATTQIKLIGNYFRDRIAWSAKQTDSRVLLAINLIIESGGTTTVKKLTEQLHTTERTLQRQFVAAVGISPKQFAKIIQFQSSLKQISQDSMSKLTDIVFLGGYADQSHFIRDFKKYAGQNPNALKNKR